MSVLPGSVPDDLCGTASADAEVCGQKRIADLLERVKAARGPNYQLEADLWLEFEWGGQGDRRTPPNYTYSLDAALALVERVLPGWVFVLNSHQKSALLARTPIHMAATTERAATLPLALLAALLSALTNGDHKVAQATRAAQVPGEGSREENQHV